MESMKQIGANTRRHRKKQGLFIKDLATMAGVSENCLTQLENGTRWPNLYTVACLADALGLSVAEYINPPKPEVDPHVPLVRGSVATGSEFIQRVLEKVQAGELTINAARKSLGLPPIEPAKEATK